jgi:type 1 glutamine amidotransferase
MESSIRNELPAQETRKNKMIHDAASRREFLRAIAMGSAGLALSSQLSAAKTKSVLLFTKSSGFEHAVIKTTPGNPSVVEKTLRGLAQKYNFEVTATKDGRVFDSKEFHDYSALFFFTTGDLTTEGTDKNPPMTTAGKQTLLDAIHGGMGFVGAHAAADTFHTPPDPQDLSNRYLAHGKDSDPYLQMLGGEFIIHGRDPRLQTADIVINDLSFPGLDGVKSPVSFKEEWYSLKDFSTDIHVILTLDTKGMKNECYERPPYPMTWARMHGKGRVFYTAIGDLAENWETPFFVNVVGGGVRWAIGDVNAKLTQNIKEAAPGYAVIPPKFPPAAAK